MPDMVVACHPGPAACRADSPSTRQHRNITHTRSCRDPARTGVTRIPVIVHVVYNTAAQNISDAQCQSQIDVLNQDFRRQNPDVAQVPAVWQAITADCRIEFQLATTDPSGNPTNGVTRTPTSVTAFG